MELEGEENDPVPLDTHVDQDDPPRPGHRWQVRLIPQRLVPFERFDQQNV